ncbi:NAD(P)-dependent oxidoreductase [Candidatus Saganbacteria bacterium]|uniref:NAD(P)-dependent oxidoreductase n=1 Tax=Candidatus Saganbacteria bacterium TaxID=2575572 RepID=A0A9D6YXU7_UNCSA|nr:NAD(P)-dependent oxidoreductase [Candidatus Saganbacteria bacterium]
MKRKIFATGIGGCVGHYLFDELAANPEYELYFLVRDPQKLKFDYPSRPNVTLIRDDLKNIKKHAEIIRQMDAVIHLAADWGGNEGNYDYSADLFNLLDPGKCKKVIYFSTASILGPDNQPVEEAEKFGTHYIRSKYRFYKKLPALKIYPNVITLFPTWVLGGDRRHPYSHASSGILALRRWLWLIRFFTVEACFHFIHARDIALIVKHLLENPSKDKNYVLGNAPLSASDFIRQTCRFFNEQVFFQIPLPLSLVKAAVFLTGKKLHPWDIFSLSKEHFTYAAVGAEHFGYRSDLQTVEQILNNLTA